MNMYGLTVAALAFCGATITNAQNTVTIESEPGDFIGQGQTATFPIDSAAETNFDAGVTVRAGGFDFQLVAPDDVGVLTPGVYNDATRWPFNDSDVPGLSASGNGRGCNALTGRFIVHEIEIDGMGGVNALAADLEQFCDNSLSALVAFIRLNTDIGDVDFDGDGVVDIRDNCVDIPNPMQIDTDDDGVGNLCDMIQGTTYVWLDSEAGDFIGQGIEWLLTPTRQGPVALTSDSASFIALSAGGFNYRFEAIEGDVLTVGAYEGATRYPFNDATEPGLSVSGNGRGCNQLGGRFDILELERNSDGQLQNLAINFEQFCENGTAALNGQIRLNAETVDTEDADGDAIFDLVDNCVAVPNSDQRDTDADDFGNVCDGDFDGDLNVNAVDLGIMRTVFFTADANVDLNGDGVVNFVDLGLLRVLFFAPPGPNGDYFPQ